MDAWPSFAGAGYPSDFRDSGTTTQSGGGLRVAAAGENLDTVGSPDLRRAAADGPTRNAGVAWQLAEARCCFFGLSRQLLPCCCSAAATPGGDERLWPGTGGGGAASAARSRGRGSRLGRPGRHARAGRVSSGWGVLVCIYILTMYCIYPMFIRRCVA